MKYVPRCRRCPGSESSRWTRSGTATACAGRNDTESVGGLGRKPGRINQPTLTSARRARNTDRAQRGGLTLCEDEFGSSFRVERDLFCAEPIRFQGSDRRDHGEYAMPKNSGPVVITLVAMSAAKKRGKRVFFSYLENVAK